MRPSSDDWWPDKPLVACAELEGDERKLMDCIIDEVVEHMAGLDMPEEGRRKAIIELFDVGLFKLITQVLDDGEQIIKVAMMDGNGGIVKFL